MKTIRILVSIVLLTLVGWYFSGPYLAVEKFESAIFEKNSEKLAQLIDEEDLKKSSKDITFEAAVAASKMKAPQMPEEAIREKLRAFFESAPIVDRFNQSMKPEVVAKAMIAAAKSKNLAGLKKSWESPSEFSVETPGQPGKVIFKLKGLNWKLSRVELPASETLKSLPAGQ